MGNTTNLKTYNVIIEHRGEITSSFSLYAANYSDAMISARANKRLNRIKGVVKVYLDRCVYEG
jgi:uncharacterized protein (UPF0297 family)